MNLKKKKIEKKNLHKKLLVKQKFKKQKNEKIQESNHHIRFNQNANITSKKILNGTVQINQSLQNLTTINQSQASFRLKKEKLFQKQVNSTQKQQNSTNLSKKSDAQQLKQNVKLNDTLKLATQFISNNTSLNSTNSSNKSTNSSSKQSNLANHSQNNYQVKNNNNNNISQNLNRDQSVDEVKFMKTNRFFLANVSQKASSLNNSNNNISLNQSLNLSKSFRNARVKSSKKESPIFNLAEQLLYALNKTSQFLNIKSDQWQNPNYVPKLSNYAQEDLRYQKYLLVHPEKVQYNLVGKKFYKEDNITYDESPNIFTQVIQTQTTNADKPVDRSQTLYPNVLWRNIDQNAKIKRFEDVIYGTDDEQIQQLILQKNKLLRGNFQDKFDDLRIRQQLSNKTSLSELRQNDSQIDSKYVLAAENPMHNQSIDYSYTRKIQKNFNNDIDELDKALDIANKQQQEQQVKQQQKQQVQQQQSQQNEQEQKVKFQQIERQPKGIIQKKKQLKKDIFDELDELMDNKSSFLQNNIKYNI